jgi:hypothetical protein
MMLCPNCLREVSSFPMTKQDTGRAYRCPECNELVPVMYAEDYAKFGPVIFSVMGYSGHGKTVYLDSLLHQFDDMAAHALDQADLESVRRRLRVKKSGDLPAPTAKVFNKPLIMRLSNVQSYGNCDLLMFDQSGETFGRVEEIKTYAPYLFRSKVLIWLVSLTDVEDKGHLADMLNRYVLAIRDLGGKPQDQSLIIVLTKGDELVHRPQLPASVRQFLNGSDEQSSPAALEQLSTEIKTWLETTEGHQRLVRQAQSSFKEVRYCIISALGSAPANGQVVTATPCGVMAPLYWAMRFSKRKFPLAASPVGGWLKGWKNARHYKAILNHPDLIAYCSAHRREAERQRALQQLAEGRTELAARLVEAFHGNSA